MTVEFKLAKTKKDLGEIYNYNMSAFLDEDEFPWSLPWIEAQDREGHDIYQVKYRGEVVAALFTRVTKKGLLTKQTPIKFNVQGLGLSHKIKEYAEVLAKKAKKKDIFNYCAIDNFRMAALNESHGYKKTSGGVLEGGGTIVEWHKSL